jgi:hypothetical protein
MSVRKHFFRLFPNCWKYCSKQASVKWNCIMTNAMHKFLIYQFISTLHVSGFLLVCLQRQVYNFGVVHVSCVRCQRPGADTIPYKIFLRNVGTLSQDYTCCHMPEDCNRQDGSFKHIYIVQCRNRTNLRLSEWRNGGVAPRSLNIRSEWSWAKYLKNLTALLVLGAFGKLRKVNTSFCRSCLAHTYGRTRPPLDACSYNFWLLLKSVMKTQIWFKWDKNIKHFACSTFHFVNQRHS